MAIRTLYFDESGFTGYNLLDPAQPIFAIASVDVEQQRALDILTDSFPKYQGTEFKFSNIWGSNNRVGLLKYAEHLRSFAELSFIYISVKRFAVLTKIVDFLIEPYLTDAGYDFYGDGFCWKYSNYIYFGFTQFAPPELLDALLRNYQAFSRNPSLKSLALLHSQLRIMAASSDEPVKLFLEQMELGANLFLDYHNIDTFGGSDELQATTMFAIVSHWRQKYPEDFAVVHDASSNFLRSREMWERITSANVPPQSYRGGDGSAVEFPLRVVSTTAVDSKNSRCVQFCDVLAGLAARHFSPRTAGEDRSFMNEVLDAGLKEITYNGIQPDTEFPDQIPPKPLQGPDAIDQMMKIMFGPHGKKQQKDV
jgi:hypothetical protein